MWDGQGEARRHYPRMAEIKEVVARHNGLTVADLESACRKKALAWPRQIAAYLCRTLTLCSYPEIGRAFGDRDHTTILFSFRKIAEMRGDTPALDATITAYETEIDAVMQKRVAAEATSALHYAPRQMVVRRRMIHRPWRDTELADIKAAAIVDASAKDIAANFHERSFFAVREKLRAVRADLTQAEAVS